MTVTTVFLTRAVRFLVAAGFTDPHDSDIRTFRSSYYYHPDPLVIKDLHTFVGTAFFTNLRRFQNRRWIRIDWDL